MTMNGSEARDMPPSPGSDHTRPGDMTMAGIAVPIMPRVTGTRCSPCVTTSTENPGAGTGRLRHPSRAPEPEAAAIVRVPRSACRAGPADPTGRK